jgi:16S rRNA processing protein RimM
MSIEKRLRVGVISSVHGIHGECKVYPTTDDMTRFKDLKYVYAVDASGRETRLQINSVKFFKNMVICGFEGITLPEEIVKLKGRDLMIDRCDAVPLEEGEYFIADLIGLKVLDEDGHELGEVTDMFPTGANQVMEVRLAEGRTVLFPYISECVLGVDPEGGSIRVHVMKGLLDL